MITEIMSVAPVHGKQANILNAAWLDTPLGPMLAVADDAALHLLEFAERKNLEQEIKRLRYTTKAGIIPGKNTPITMIENELKDYFDGKITVFETPLFLLGSDFQKLVWEELQKIPMGQTRSYAQLATAIGRSSAYRAVARANSTNHLAIIIPCHRIINSNNELGGYASGVARKEWLINHEKRVTS